MTSNWWPFVGALIISVCIGLFVGFSTGAIPTHTEYCYQTGEANHEHCAAYNVALFAVWKIGETLNWWAPGIAALASVVIAWFTRTLWRATDRLWLASENQVAAARTAAEAAKDSADAARDNLIKTFRPKIRVRKVSIREVRRGEPRIPYLDISFSIANIGDSEATIQQAFAGLWWDARIPAVFPDELPSRVGVSKPDMAPGEVNVETAPTDQRGANFLANRLMKEQLYFWGAIRYTDAQRRIRETAFCRRYDRHSKRFIAVDDPDFEHED